MSRWDQHYQPQTYSLYYLEIDENYYVGHTKNLEKRTVAHNQNLRQNKHSSKKFQEVYNLSLHKKIKVNKIKEFTTNHLYGCMIEEELAMKELEAEGKRVLNSERYNIDQLKEKMEWFRLNPYQNFY